jgi:cell division protein ZapA (FtsZ GTPase activity inhibitor)
MDTNEIIKQRFEVLPQDIKDAITKTDLAGKFDSIANKHGLHIDQNGLLQTETLLVMIGLETTEDYIDNVQKALNISKSETLSIADDVNKEIFNGIRQSLQTMQDEFMEAEKEMGDQTDIEPKQNIQTNTPNPNQTKKPLVGAPSMITPTTPFSIISQKPSPEDIQSQYTKIDHAPIEQAGGFVIDVEPRKVEMRKEEVINKETILKGIEDKESGTDQMGSEMNMIDSLLFSPVSSTQKVESLSSPEEETVQANSAKAIEKGYSTDPYREQM